MCSSENTTSFDRWWYHIRSALAEFKTMSNMQAHSEVNGATWLSLKLKLVFISQVTTRIYVPEKPTLRMTTCDAVHAHPPSPDWVSAIPFASLVLLQCHQKWHPQKAIFSPPPSMVWGPRFSKWHLRSRHFASFTLLCSLVLSLPLPPSPSTPVPLLPRHHCSTISAQDPQESLASWPTSLGSYLPTLIGRHGCPSSPTGRFQRTSPRVVK